MKVLSLLDHIMRARSLTNEGLARRAEVGVEAVRALRRNTWRGVRRETLRRLTRALGVRSIAELFALVPSDIWGPIFLHRTVTVHFTSKVRPMVAPRAPGVLDPQAVGYWDLSAYMVLLQHLHKKVPGVRIDVVMHAAGDTNVSAAVRQVLAKGCHIVFGSQVGNPFVEELLSAAYDVPPYTPEQRSAFPYAFAWDADHDVPSSFGARATGAEVGVVRVADGALVARHAPVAQGPGEDAGLVMFRRTFRPPRDRLFGLDDEYGVLVLLGFSGVGTGGIARVVTDDDAAAALYPTGPRTPVLRAVQVEYFRPPSPTNIDNREVRDASLVPEKPDHAVRPTPPAGGNTGGSPPAIRRGPRGPGAEVPHPTRMHLADGARTAVAARRKTS